MGVPECPVEVAPEHRLGCFANAFRIVEGGTSEECLLDFLVYSEREGKAQVVSRVRIRPTLLASIRDRLTGLLGAADFPG